MDIQMLTPFFMWCTILNFGMLVITSLVFLFGMDLVYRIHSRWFPMPRETFNVVLYCFVGFYKLMVITFSLVPYLALVIMG